MSTTSVLNSPPARRRFSAAGRAFQAARTERAAFIMFMLLLVASEVIA